MPSQIFRGVNVNRAYSWTNYSRWFLRPPPTQSPSTAFRLPLSTSTPCLITRPVLPRRFLNSNGTGSLIMTPLLTSGKGQGFQVLGVRTFKTSSPRPAIPPLILVLMAKLGKVFSVFLGRNLRVYWKKLPPETQAQYIGRAKKYRLFFYSLLGALGAGSVFYYQTHIQETPLTHRRRFVAFTEDQLNEISKHELDILVATYKDKILPAADRRHKDVYKVAQRLVNANRDLLGEEGKKKTWTVSVIDDDSTINAFVLSCGSIFVFSGLLTLCQQSEGDWASRLSIILGHELSHVILNHSAEQASLLHLIDLVLILPVAALWAVLPSDATAAFAHWVVGKMTDLFFALPYGRQLEMEADEVGLILSAKACYDVRECIIWKELEILNSSGIEGDVKIDIFSTHPSEDKRYEKLQEKLAAALQTRVDCNCPKLPFMDPDKRMESYKRRKVVIPKFELAPLKL